MTPALLLRTALATAASVMTIVPTAHASYLNLQPAVMGESTSPGHAGWMYASLLQWGVSVGVTSPGPGGGTHQVGPASLSEMVWGTGETTSLPSLMATALSGTILPTARFDSVRSESGKPYLSIATEKAVVTSVSQSGIGGYVNTSASLGYAKLALTYDPAGLNKPGSAVTTSYYLVTRETTGSTMRAPLSFTGTSTAADGVYMRLGDAANPIAGEVVAAGYENWIRLGSFQFGVGLGYDPLLGMVSQPSVSDLTVSQEFDATIPAVLSSLLRGKALGQVTIEVVKTGWYGPATYMQVALNDVLFSGLSLSEDGGRVRESLNFSGISQTVWPLLLDGTRGTPTSVSFDVATGQSGPGVLAASVAGFGNGNLSPTVVPEPQAWVMMVAGAGALFGVMRRRGRVHG